MAEYAVGRVSYPAGLSIDGSQRAIVDEGALMYRVHAEGHNERMMVGARRE
jgi:hypothetical protein